MFPPGRGSWRLLGLSLLVWPLAASRPGADDRELADVPAYRARAGRIGGAEKAAWAERMRAERLACGSPEIDPALARLRELCRAGALDVLHNRPAGISRCLGNLTLLAEMKGRLGLAEDLYCEAVHVLDGVEAPPQFRQEDALRDLANFYRLHGRDAERQAALERALAVGRAERVPYRLGEAWTLEALARFHLEHGRFAAAAPLLEREVALLDELGMGNLAETTEAFAQLARAYRALGRLADAEPLLERSLRFVRRYTRGDHLWPLALRQRELGQLYLEEGKLTAAEPLLRLAAAELDATAAAHPEWHDLDGEQAVGLAALAALCERTGRAAEALALRARAEALKRSVPPAPRWQPTCPPADAALHPACVLPVAAVAGRLASELVDHQRDAGQPKMEVR
jgi:tetratricopeptide (TPR) repeat protein